MPSTIDTVSYPPYGLPVSTFFAQGLYWIFLNNNAGSEGWYSSPDGYNWSSFTQIGVWGGGEIAAVVDDNGQYVHAANVIGGQVEYRRGLLVSNGTITWNALQVADAAALAHFPEIVLDSGGMPWIGYQSFDTAITLPYVTSSTTNNGVWTTRPGFRVQLNAQPDDRWLVRLARLSASQVYIAYGSGSDFNLTRGRLYNAGMGVEETYGFTHSTKYGQVSVVADSHDTVHLTYDFGLAAPYATFYTKRPYSTGVWSAEVQLTGGNAVDSFVQLTIDTDTDDVYAFYYYTDGFIRMRKYDAYSGTWLPEATIVVDNIYGVGFPSLYPITSQRKKQNNSVGIMYYTDKVFGVTNNRRFSRFNILGAAQKSCRAF